MPSGPRCPFLRAAHEPSKSSSPWPQNQAGIAHIRRRRRRRSRRTRIRRTRTRTTRMRTVGLAVGVCSEEGEEVEGGGRLPFRGTSCCRSSRRIWRRITCFTRPYTGRTTHTTHTTTHTHTTITTTTHDVDAHAHLAPVPLLTLPR